MGRTHEYADRDNPSCLELLIGLPFVLAILAGVIWLNETATRSSSAAEATQSKEERGNLDGYYGDLYAEASLREAEATREFEAALNQEYLESQTHEMQTEAVGVAAAAEYEETQMAAVQAEVTPSPPSGLPRFSGEADTITAHNSILLSQTASFQTSLDRLMASRLPMPPTTRPTSTPRPICWRVLSDANLRAGPGTEYAIVGSAEPGGCLPLSGRNPGGSWVAFRDASVFGPGVTVWIWKKLVTGNAVSLPIISTPIPDALGTAEANRAWADATGDALIAKSEYATIQAEETEVASEFQSAPSALGCPPGGCTTYPSWCGVVIKGNVGFESGERIYHVPGQKYYDATKISPEYGERWFCAEGEALAAGWRKAYE